MDMEGIRYIIFLIIDIISLAIYLWLVVGLKNVRAGVFAGNNPESSMKRKIFLAMCGFALLQGTASVINDTIYFVREILRYSIGTIPDIVQLLNSFLAESTCTLLTLLWMLFIDYCVYKSPDHIRKRYTPYHIAAGAAILLSAVSVISILITFPDPSVAVVVIMLLDTFIVVPVIQVIYIITAYRIVSGHLKERRPPLFLRLSAFIVPVVIGCVLGVFIHSSLRSLGFAIGLLLTVRIQKNRNRYIDPDTGFYNMGFLQLMYEHLEKDGYLKGIGIIFSTPDRKDELIKAVGQLDYDNSEIILLEGGKVLLTTGEQKKEAVELIIRYVSAVASAADPPFEISSDTIVRSEGESAESFTARIIETADRLAG